MRGGALRMSEAPEMETRGRRGTIYGRVSQRSATLGRRSPPKTYPTRTPCPARPAPAIVSRPPRPPCSKVRTESLDDFLRVLNTLHDGARVPLRYLLPYSQHQERLAVITIERTWCARVFASRPRATS